jgi:hypothetical protein
MLGYVSLADAKEVLTDDSEAELQLVCIASHGYDRIHY